MAHKSLSFHDLAEISKAIVFLIPIIILEIYRIFINIIVSITQQAVLITIPVVWAVYWLDKKGIHENDTNHNWKDDLVIVVFSIIGIPLVILLHPYLQPILHFILMP